MRPIAVVDVGSNSICLLVLMVKRDGTLVVVEKLKDTARLRDAVGPDGTLSAEGIDRAVGVLKQMRQAIDGWGEADERCVATAALRAARNAGELVRRAATEAGVTVEIISGEDEARLAWTGVLHGMAGSLGDKLVLCADVGGGSSELLLGRSGKALGVVSVPIGALVATRTWLGPDPVTPDAVAHARQALRQTFAPAVAPLQQVAAGEPLVAVATSGTVQRLARIAKALEGQVPQPDVHGLVLQRADLDRVLATLAAAPTTADRLRIPGMDPSRVDSLLGGGLIYEALCDVLDLPAWTVSMDGLRMGVAAELFRRQQAAFERKD